MATGSMPAPTAQGSAGLRDHRPVALDGAPAPLIEPRRTNAG